MNSDMARALIADHLAVGVHRVVDRASFVEDLGADSLDMVELAMRFEEALDICITDDESEFCSTVGDALRLIGSKIGARAAA
jgi:acyl carrier protein